MTVKEAITKSTKDGITADENSLISWLSDLDGQIFNDILSGYEGAIPPPKDYTASTILVVPAPYANDVYVEYLRARIYLSLQETTKHNNCLSVHKEQLSLFAAYYLRTHTPVQRFISGASL
jgi:hypothetical protein